MRTIYLFFTSIALLALINLVYNVRLNSSFRDYQSHTECEEKFDGANLIEDSLIFSILLFVGAIFGLLSAVCYSDIPTDSQNSRPFDIDEPQNSPRMR